MRIRQELKHGNARWVVDYRDGRNRRRPRFFSTALAAQEFAVTVTARRPSQTKGPQLRIENLFDAYINATEPRRTPEVNQGTIYRLRMMVAACETAGVHLVAEITEGSFARIIKTHWSFDD